MSTDASLTALDWPQFLNRASQEAKTALGREGVQRLIHPESWAMTLTQAQELQEETQEISLLLGKGAMWAPLDALEDPTPALEILERGGVLEQEELALVYRWIDAGDAWFEIPREEVSGRLLRKALAGLPKLHRLLQTLRRILTPEGRIAENATAELTRLHQLQRRTKAQLEATLGDCLRRLSSEGYLQESFSDLREGRYVVPVKISAQSKVEGRILDASVSKQTVFIEPQEVEQQNNELRRVQNAIAEEIYKLLKEVSDQVRAQLPEVRLAVSTLAHWDSVSARARLAKTYSGAPLQVVQSRQFFLRETAHPLLWWALQEGQIIRNDIVLTEPAQAIVFTGPNAGGKTVILKTLGLAGICARTGFQLPGSGKMVVPFFSNIFADIGDPQSIANHLSSFAGHLTRVRDLLDDLKPDSLVLLDEVGAATDPEEGAALALALTEILLEKGAMLVITTHDPYFKGLAYRDPRVLNASMQFEDLENRPSFRIVLGTPGRSRAIETAERLGVNEDLIRRAKGFLSDEHFKMNELLAALDQTREAVDHERREARRLRDEAEKLKKDWEERTLKDLGENMDQLRRRLKQISAQAQEEVQGVIRRFEESNMGRRKIIQSSPGEAPPESSRSTVARALDQSMEQALAKAQQAVTEEMPFLGEIEEKRAQEKHARKDHEVGDWVRLPRWKNVGRIVQLDGKRLKVLLGSAQASGLQITVSREDAEQLSEEDLKALQSKVPGTSSIRVSSSSVELTSTQLDLRGQRYEEAMSQVERFLDQAYRANVKQVTVIHGFGTGALRDGTRKLLKTLPYVRAFADGGSGQGGAGATVVEFEI